MTRISRSTMTIPYWIELTKESAKAFASSSSMLRSPSASLMACSSSLVDCSSSFIVSSSSFVDCSSSLVVSSSSMVDCSSSLVVSSSSLVDCSSSYADSSWRLVSTTLSKSTLVEVTSKKTMDTPSSPFSESMSGLTWISNHTGSAPGRSHWTSCTRADRRSALACST